MIVRPYLIFGKTQTVYFLPHLTFPDFKTSFDFTHYVIHEWKPPPNLLTGFVIPPDCEVKYSISAIIRDPAGDWAYMFLSITNAHLVSVQMYQALKDTHKRIIDMMRRGMSDKQMALRLGRSRRWVQYRIAELKRYYRVKTRLDLEIKICTHAILKRS